MELIRYLSERQKFPNVPGLLSARSMQPVTAAAPRMLALLVDLVPNEGDAYTQTLDALGRYIERVLCEKTEIAAGTMPDCWPSSSAA